ncbi:hypothetical protein BC830DRAFT_1137316 [Chytriomyces sp. MP71]|nr:hypothetical protein BC830DRAFT_1137316 [Chytriomyces sp. MP71]
MMVQSGVEGDLAFRIGDIIEVIAEVDDNWMTGCLNGRTGIFPTEFTEPRSIKPATTITSAPPPIHSRPILPVTSPKTTTMSMMGSAPPQPPPLSSKPPTRRDPITSTSSAAARATIAASVSSFSPSLASLSSSMSNNPPQPLPTSAPSNEQYFYLRSKANGNVLGVEMGLTSMVTHDSPILVVPLTSKSGSEPLLLRMDESGCLVTPSNLAVDVRVGEWMNGGTVVLAKRVAAVLNAPPELAGLHQRWEVTLEGMIRNERGFMLVEDYGRAIVWDSSEEEVVQLWDKVMM